MRRIVFSLLLLGMAMTIPLADALAQSSRAWSGVWCIIGGAVGGRRGAAVGAITGAAVGSNRRHSRPIATGSLLDPHIKRADRIRIEPVLPLTSARLCRSRSI